MWTGFKRIVRAGFIGFWRNAYVSLASIFVMTIALFVIGATMMVDQLLTVSLQQLQEKVDINLYFVTSAQEEDIDALRTSLEALPNVLAVTYTTREQALEEFRAQYQNDEIMMQSLEELDDNPLRAKLAIQAVETDQYENIAQYIDEQIVQQSPQNPVIDNYNYLEKKESIDTLSSIIGVVEQASFTVMIVLVVAAVLITLNTIRLAIYTAREEISVMRLVGAGNTFIRGPFVLQGIMYGLVSGILALLIMYPILLWIGPGTEEFFQFNIFDYFVANFGYIFLVLVGIGVVLGIISSLFAIARYLRV
ncbi:MAG: permease-like cell division protein FtsX [Patescibacteria group bacterium]